MIYTGCKLKNEQKLESIYYNRAGLAPEKESHYKDSILEGDLFSREAGFL
jgi:hypothetical protein